jgi:hypothetical protein
VGAVRNRHFIAAAAIACVALPWRSASAEPIDIVHNGESAFCIYHLPVAPSSVRTAAKDLQYYIRRSTDAVLPIVTQTVMQEETKCRSYIRLGDRSAAVDLPFEAYHIMTRNGDVVIAGRDTKDGELTPTGGTSHGTRNGVYTFLEEFVGVRWLMPGEVGEDVPRLKELRIPELDRVDTPGFENRQIGYLQNDNPLVKQWLQRQKQGYSLQLYYHHNFKHLVSEDEYGRHPEWFAQLNGERPPPGERYKIETTNAEMVRYIARRVSDDLRRNPSHYAYAISPSDSRGWSTSPESLALYDRDPHGQVSITPLVLDFYRNVAEQVGKKVRDRILCGIVYADYLFPPTQGIPEIPDNLCLVLAPNISYGYGLYREQTRRDLEELLQRWPKVVPTISYFDLPVNILQSIGAPNPPGVEILAYLYPRLADAGMRGVYMFGISAWGQGALTNYLLAKLNWNPRADVNELAREFFLRAYGPEAGPFMQALYARVDAANKQFHVQDPDARHYLTPALLLTVYQPLIPEIQSLFGDAQRAEMTAEQRQRLWMFQVNMNRFMNYLQEAGIADLDPKSIFSDISVEVAKPKHALSGLTQALADKPDAEDVPAYKMRLRMMRDKVLQFFRGWQGSMVAGEPSTTASINAYLKDDRLMPWQQCTKDEFCRQVMRL